VEFAQEVQEVDQRPAQAIDRPGCHHVDVAAGDGLEQASPGRLPRHLAAPGFVACAGVAFFDVR
jgi:hypothetical protein